MAAPRPILFTAFEPSGDELAARLIAELRRREPNRPFFAWGGPACEAAGAEIVEHTLEHAGVALDVLAQVPQHLARLKRLRRWLKDHPIDCLVPVDSPAANWSVCAAVRKHCSESKVVHLVLPQVWGWASWRVHKLRRLTDQVLCLLPFEPDWLEEHRVPGVFVGHPMFSPAPPGNPAGDRGGDPSAIAGSENTPDPSSAQDLFRGPGLPLAILPGSRKAEIQRNLPTMLRALAEVRRRGVEIDAVLAARTDADAVRMRSWMEGEGAALGPGGAAAVVVGRTRAALRAAEAALITSGTATLQAVADDTPCAAIYNHSRWQWELLGRWIIATRTFTLPNLIGLWQDGERAIPEFAPHFGDPRPVAEALHGLCADPATRDRQRRRFGGMRAVFEGVDFDRAAADAFIAATGKP
ncbi:MAG: hypothetical protein AAGA57_09765 [Planctomycetota bacterium]